MGMHHPLWATLLLSVSIAAQDGLREQELRLHTAASQSLLAFARVAEGSKMFARAKQVYEQVLAHYDAENKPATAALAQAGREWTDQGTLAQRRSLDQAWAIVAKKG